MKKLLPLCMLIVSMAIMSCSDNDDPVKSSEKQLLSFKVKEQQATVSSNDKTVTLSFASAVDLTSLAPEIEISDKASITPASGEVKDFTSPVKYTITAEDGTTSVYTITITAVNVATHTPSASPSSTVLIANQSVIITAEVIEGASYSWYSEQSGLLETTTTNTFAISTPGKYWVVITVGGVSSLASEKITISVPFSSLKPVIAAQSSSLCGEGSSIELAVENVEDFSTEVIFTWYKDGEKVAGVTSSMYYVAEAGDYSVIAKSGEETSETSDEKNITSGLQKPAITIVESPCPNPSVILAVKDPVAGVTYQWYHNQQGMAGSGTSYVATQDGSYRVVAMNGNGCMSPISDAVEVTHSNCP